ncbi:tRNA (adenine(22)-N(1))-methyltransferase [Streptococcus caballi]|uniref:tRNA (adenine(22)-N(1))-methyltransferase n=1 Tax=Streptococcus caballi TaxID=439220 RepID=UPI00035E009E|nr:tRNA (adenine(22)-N(1))-methyltransferase TrmK [Streptococcus caballi]
METRLSQRLTAVAAYVPQNARLLDIGSDHAYLPIYLVEQNRIHFAIAGEVVKGPYQSALSNVSSSALSDKIDVRLANGLAAFEAEDMIDTITICGMGGRLIAEILENGRAKLHSVQRLILQPNNREDDLRLWLAQNDFKIVDEEIMTENDKYYEIIIAEHGKKTLSVADLRFGPLLKQEKSNVFVSRWRNELVKLETAFTKIPEVNTSDRSAISQKIQAIKEVLNEN